MIERKQELKKSFIAVIIYFIATKGLLYALVNLNLLPGSDIITRSFSSEAIVAGIALIALFVLKKKRVLNFKTTGFGEGIKASSYLLLVFGLNAFGVVGKMSAGLLPIGVGAPQILFFVLYCLMIGVAEEIMFRGILQNGFHAFYGERSYKCIAAAIICSGVCFGLYHLTNAMEPGISFSSALMQALMVIPVGIALGAAYYRSGKNIWVCVLLHALYDGIQFVAKGMLAGSVSAGDIIGGTDKYPLPQLLLSVAVFWVIGMSLALFACRKKKIHVRRVAVAAA